MIPDYAISVRQPWAWAIIYAGKDVENRTDFALRHMRLAGVSRLAVHAAKGMTRGEYEGARNFMLNRLGVTCPAPHELLRGGIIGHVGVDGVARMSQSRWFTGPKAIRLNDPVPCDFIPSVGELGLFRWSRSDRETAPPLAKWMLPPIGDQQASAGEALDQEPGLPL